MGKKSSKKKNDTRSKAVVVSAALSPKLKNKAYENALRELQVELCVLQEWVKKSGFRAVVLFEGRDAAGKGGTIRRITERVSPRVFQTVALPAPSDREKTQLYMQRYIAHMPAAGEIMLFDRSWYNRPGVERVMGFCNDQQLAGFLKYLPVFEKALVESGITLVKYWLEVSQEEQTRRFRSRMKDPRKHWKLSPMDLESHRRWYDYSRARDDMFAATDLDYAPWYVIPSDDKKRARLNCISHLLSLIPYKKIPFKVPELPDHDKRNAYDDRVSLSHYKVVPQVY